MKEIDNTKLSGLLTEALTKPDLPMASSETPVRGDNHLFMITFLLYTCHCHLQTHLKRLVIRSDLSEPVLPVDSFEAAGHKIADASQTDEHQRYADDGVPDGEESSGGCSRHDVAVPQRGDYAAREQQRLGKRPVVGPAAHLAVVAVLLHGADYLRLHYLQRVEHLITRWGWSSRLQIAGCLSIVIQNLISKK